MATRTLPQAHALAQPGSAVTRREILLVRGSHEIAPAPFSAPSTIRDLVARWVEITHDRSMPIDLLREEARLAIYGEADNRAERIQWQRWADEDIAATVNDGAVRIVRQPKRDRR
ncbi:hypothetical protein [Modestobacter sp. SYSU DS0290]